MDQVFGQLAAIISRTCWDDPDGLLDILGRICRHAKGSSRATASKIDQCAKWKDWVAHLRMQFAGMHDVHSLKFCRREDLGLAVLNAGVVVQDFPEGKPRSAGDIMMVVKEWLADKAPLQVFALFPEADTASLLANQPQQPVGITARRPISEQVQRNIRYHAPRCRAAGFISASAADYLLGWCGSTIPQISRPARLSFLEHRWQGAGLVIHPRPLPELVAARAPRPMRIVQARRGVRAAVAAEDPAVAGDVDEEGAIVPA